MSRGNTGRALEKLTRAFHSYYDVNYEDPIPPFFAEAVFRLHDERYFLVKSARVFESDSYEFVYFGEAEELTPEAYSVFEKTAWEDGLNRANPRSNHRNSDVTVVIVAETVTPECEKIVKKSKHHVNYKFSFHGWSIYRVVVYDLSKKRILYNRRGKELKKVYDNINLFE